MKANPTGAIYFIDKMVNGRYITDTLHSTINAWRSVYFHSKQINVFISIKNEFQFNLNLPSHPIMSIYIRAPTTYILHTNTLHRTHWCPSRLHTKRTEIRMSVSTPKVKKTFKEQKKKKCPRRFSLIMHNIFHLTDVLACSIARWPVACTHTHVHHVINLK